MTFSSIFTDRISRVYAFAEEDSEVILIPVSVVHGWLIRFPEINRVFYHGYDKRFSDIMSMVNDAVFHKLEKRVLNYIKQRWLQGHWQGVREILLYPMQQEILIFSMQELREARH